MANTTNYNWETPDDTDLVKDGAAAIRTLGNSIDTTTKNLNPETTTGDIAYRSATANTNTRLPIGTNGQILAVSAGVPAWINNDQGDITEVQAGTGISVASGTGPIPIVTNTVATAIDAKGDLIVGTGADTFARLAVGTNGHTLVADSSVSPQGLKWAVDPVADVITTAGDLLYGTAADTVARLGIGTAGQVLKVNSGATAPEWGAAGGTSGPAFRAFRDSSAQSITYGTYNKVQLNAETYDTASCFDSTTNYRFTPTTAGYYQLNFTVQISSATEEILGIIYKNGTASSRGSTGKADTEYSFGLSSGSDLIYFNGSSDYVELYAIALQNAGSPSIYNGTAETFFTGVWIRS